MRRKPLALALRLTALIAPALYAAGALPPVTSSSPEVPRAGQAAEVTSIREVRLTANDLIVDPNTQTIYASVPADVASGNSIVALNPTAASLGNPVFIGSSPGKMAITTDGQFIYVILNGAGAVRRFDLATQTAGPQFTMGNEPFDGPFFALSLAAAPGNPHLFAVFRLVRAGGFTGNVAVFDEGVRRDSVFALPENSAAVAFGADASKLYSYAPLPRRLARLAVSSAGVAATGTSQLNLPTTTDAIKYVDGRLYTGSGFVLDPEAGTTLGTFPQGGLRPTWPFAVDPTAGRAFYVTSSAQTMTVRAFDLNTFQEVGSIDLPGAAPGEPTGLVRWGSNGLALSTTQGRVFLIQSTLVPSGDPVPTFTPTPTPSPTPSPTPFETQVRRISLPTRDIGFSAATGLIYATLPSSAGPNGNSVTAVDPVTGAVGGSVFVGSEPGRMSLTADGQHIYVALTGASAVRRFDVATQTAGPQFMLVNNPAQGGDFATDLAPVPGSPDSVAVSSSWLAIYDDGGRRAKTSVGAGGSLEFSESPTRLYSAASASSGATLHKHTADASGVTTTQSFNNLLRSGDIAFDSGRLYVGPSNSAAQVFDPEAGTMLASFRLGNPQLSNGERCDRGSVLPDPSTNRVFFLCSEQGQLGTFIVRILAFDTETFVSRGTINITGVTGDIGRMVRWGENGLAFRTNSSQLFLIQSTLVSSEEPVPAATPTPTPTPVPTPTVVPTPAPGELRGLNLTAKDLVVDPITQTIFASIPSSAGASGNSITPIDPVAGAAGTPVPVGSEPGKMAVSDDGQFVYVVLDGASAVRRFDVATRAAGPQFDLGTDPQFGPYGAEDIEVAPGQPGVVAVARTRPGVSPRHGGVAIYENGVRRPITTPPHTGSNRIGFSSSPSVLYGQNVETSGFGFYKMGVASCGVSTASVITHPFLSSDFSIAGGLSYTIGGRVYNPEDGTLLGTFSGGGGPVVPDTQAGRVYFVGTVDGTNVTLRVYDANTYLLIGSLRLPGVSGFPTTLVRWGEHGLAFNSGAQVFLLQHALIGGSGGSPSAPAPAAPTFNATGRVVAFGGGTADNVTLSVTGAVTANLSTGDGSSFTLGPLQQCAVPFVITPSKPDYVFTPASLTVTNLSSVSDLQFNAVLKSVGFTRTATSVAEGAGKVQIVVTRVADTSQSATVSFETVSGAASDRSDFNTSLGTLNFAPGQASRTIDVLLNDDAFAEGPETFTVVLKNPAGVHLNTFASSITVTILDNDATTAPSNPIDGAAFFVRRHYADFLNREPDQDGLNHWVNQTANCGAADLLVCRVNVSAAFFLSIENQESGYLVHRAHKAAYGDLPQKPVPLTFREYLAGSRQIGGGVQVGVGDWQQQLEQNKNAFFDGFAAAARFTALYNGQTNEQYVDALNQNAGGALSQAEADALKADLMSGAKTRAQVLRAVAEDGDFARAEQNRAFVLAQYFGYLRRDPDAVGFNGQPDPDFAGYRFWLQKLDEFEGNFVQAEMVRAFIESIEYRQRFGQ